MRRICFYKNFRNFFRSKHLISTLLILGFLLFSLEIVIHNDGFFVNNDNDRDRSYRDNVLFSSGAGIDFSGSRRHNRNLQNLYPNDINHRKASKLDQKYVKSQMRINTDYVQIRKGISDYDTSGKISMTAGQSNFVLAKRNKSRALDRPNPDANVAATKRLPQAIIIGVKKGGTRALLEFLRAHPDVRATGPEPHFFDKYYDKGLEWYRDIMPVSYQDQITIEKTPSYFVTKEVPRRVMEMSRDVKFLVVVRDPVIRAISDYAQVTSRLKKFKSFEEMTFLDNNTQIIDTSWAVIKIGLYAKHLQHWLQVFPLEQFHFVNGENLIKNPGDEIIDVQNFLGLDIVLTHKNFITNTTRGFPCIRKKISGKGHCLDAKKGRPHPYVPPHVIQKLRDFYRPFNAKFYKMVGRSFHWP